MGWICGGCLLFGAIAVGLLVRYVAFPPDRIELHPNGRIKARGKMLEGDRRGRWTFWDTEGRPECRGDYAEGYEIGVWTFFHTNGSEAARGELDGWCRIGEWNFRDEAGNALAEAEFLARYPAFAGGRFPARLEPKAVARK